MNSIVVIPARYDSSRFPGKVLANETGKFLVEHTYERALCAKSVRQVIIATDSDKVMAACETFGAKCVMTSVDHQSGTDRIAEAVAGLDVDIVVNLQADEPEIDSGCIDMLVGLLVDNPDADVATLVAGFDDAGDVSNPNIVKVVCDNSGMAIYFSRSVIPYDRDNGGVGDVSEYLRHLGIYAYRKDFLLKYTQLAQSRLEKLEKLEQLRVIENGYNIITGKVAHAWAGIDTAEQYGQFVKRINTLIG
ncbi:MAG: 3-deoxy-manno-octulosonate cytidylyltransferase [Anaerohalosphaera sp.]|nr:3-deoxy-manno-octulosonate cytidylyltransferase [Anaerohalosphaera sp.]